MHQNIYSHFPLIFPIPITMENSTSVNMPSKPPPIDYHSNVDTSRPFSSVKEAVAIFGERFLTPEVYSPKPFSFSKKDLATTYNTSSSPSWKYHTPSPSFNNKDTLVDTLKKLEHELEETKEELKSLKEREAENEVALASLNAELHKNMSKIAYAEAAVEEWRRRNLIVGMGSSPTLAQILGFSQKIEGSGFGGKSKKERKNDDVVERKKKPIIPLLGDLFWKKKGSSTTLRNPLFSSPSVHWN